MNENLKYGLFFLGGVALGAVGAVAVSRGKLDLRPFATELMSRGLDARDALMARAEAVRENVEDMVAEAHAVSEQRKAVRPGAFSAERAGAFFSRAAGGRPLSQKRHLVFQGGASPGMRLLVRPERARSIREIA